MTKLIEGIIVQGHQVASGANQNPLFPGGTLAMQIPHFQDLGLDLSDWHLATVNTSIAPYDFSITRPDWYFENVEWHPTEPAEDFSFVKIKITVPPDDIERDGLIYYPHPETKPAHHQPSGMLEILLRDFVEGISYGTTINLHLPSEQVKITNP